MGGVITSHYRYPLFVHLKGEGETTGIDTRDTQTVRFKRSIGGGPYTSGGEFGRGDQVRGVIIRGFGTARTRVPVVVYNCHRRNIAGHIGGIILGGVSVAGAGEPCIISEQLFVPRCTGICPRTGEFEGLPTCKLFVHRTRGIGVRGCVYHRDGAFGGRECVESLGWWKTRHNYVFTPYTHWTQCQKQRATGGFQLRALNG